MASNDREWRLFFAVQITDPVKENAAEAQREIEREVRGVVKWVERANLHLTLKFVGSVPESRVEEVVNIGTQAALAGRSCCLRIVGAGAFPSPRQPRVIWLGVEGETESVIRVATELDRLLAQANLAQAENRPLTLHLTLGRVRRGKKAPDLTAILSRIGAKEFGTVRVEDFVLMRSHLRPDGPLYQVICSFALTTGIAETREE